MSFVSYAQNFEDVMLWRALKHIEQGFYIDVGAWSPDLDSVTRAFYARGWKGINIEPNPGFHQQLQERRPQDINLRVAVSDHDDVLVMNFLSNPGLSTLDDDIARRHQESGWETDRREVQVTTLAAIWQQHVPSGRPVHFLKVDVEGFEKAALKGNDWTKNRPWIVVVEATLPMSQVESHEAWEATLLGASYRFAYADGLNRFYVSEEHSELIPAFQYPPNVFDQFVLSGQVHAEALSKQETTRAEQAEGRAQQSEAWAQQSEARAQQSEARTQQEAIRADQAESRAQQSEARAQQSEARTQQEAIRADQAESRAQQSEARTQQLEFLLQQKEREINEWHERVVQLHKSTSWRITKPLRVTKRLVTSDPLVQERQIGISIAQTKQLIKPVVLGAMNFVLTRPAIKARIAWLLRSKYPNLYKRLRTLKGRQVNHNAQFLSISGPILHAGPYSGKKVAVLAPAAADGATGGAERFHEGLAEALRQNGCVVDLIYRIFDESSFETIKRGYQAFSELNLSEYDLVISTKAPSYVINHQNHVMYLQHTIRVFYDMFDVVFPNADETLCEQRTWIHKIDTEAFKRIKFRFSQSREIARRLQLWNDCDAEVLHPEIVVNGLYDQGIGDYFYMPGRLHPWKRVDLAIKAVKFSKLPLRLVISGTGEAESALRKLAGNDKRIEFLGRVTDEQLKELYANALAVPFLPIREDYGYVTLEAFACGKPVITCTDSGEPIEFVVDGETGFVCSPDPQAICLAFEQLWNDRTLAARMGQAGRKNTADIKWGHVVERLLEAGFPDIKISRKVKNVPIKVAVLDMQPIMPAIGGGRLRLLGIYHALGPDIQARYVGTYDWPGEKYRRHAITSTLDEIDVPLSEAHHQAAANAAKEAGGKTVIDMLFAQQAHLSPDYLKETLEAVKWADVVVFSHPWVAPLVSNELLVGKTIIYDSHNVEAALRAQLLNASDPFEQYVLDEVVRSERIAGDRADLILACSLEDINGFVAHYGWQRYKIHLVPNGVFCSMIQPASTKQKMEARERFGVSKDAFVGFFIGSDYAPNYEAALYIIEQLAHGLPGVFFTIAGGVCSRLPSNLPANVRAIGFLEEQDKVRWLHASDFALNPMFSGSGTNIKMFEFMSAGLPVVTTTVGARGITQQSSIGLRLAGREELVRTLRQLLRERQEAIAGGQDNRHIVETKYAWEFISPELGRTIRSAHFRKQGATLLSNPLTAIRLRVAHLSTVGLKCGIGEYTRKIIDIYQQHGISNLLLAGRAANEEPNLADLKVPSEIVWYFDNIEWQHSNIQPRTIQAMLDWGATHLLVQYHPGFYTSDRLYQLVTKAKEHGIAVKVVVHNFTEETVHTMRQLNDLGVLLFSHRMTEVVQARRLGVSLDYIPHGINAPESIETRSIEERDWKQCPPIIATTGFLRRHKGAVTLIQSMVKVREQYPSAILQLRCALYPSEDSQLELEYCSKEIARLNLQDNVIFDTRFLEKSEVYRELAKADIAVLPYEKSNEGSSGTAMDCLAVGLPLIVSDAEIFDEIRDVVLTALPDSRHTSEAILRVLSEPELYASLANQSVSYARSNSWNSVSGAFLFDFDNL